MTELPRLPMEPSPNNIADRVALRPAPRPKVRIDPDAVAPLHETPAPPESFWRAPAKVVPIRR
jgi:hypothetical protein